MAIAKHMRLFEKHGASIAPVFYQDYPQSLRDLASGKLDATFAGLYEVLKSNIEGVQVVLVTDFSDGAEGLVVIDSIRNPSDLKHKRIGIQGPLSGSEFVVITFLRRQGIDVSEVSLVDVIPENLVAEMPHNVQGGYVWDPFLSRAVAQGYRILFTTADTKGMVPDVVAFQQAAVKERAIEVQGFVDAWFEAVEFWKTNPEQAKLIIMKETGVKDEEVTLKGCRLMSRDDNRRAFQARADPESLHFVAKAQIEFFTGLGDASKAPSPQRVLNSSFLK
jgi:NitT/TauT family transport system substrate-binding protein